MDPIGDTYGPGPAEVIEARLGAALWHRSSFRLAEHPSDSLKLAHGIHPADAWVAGRAFDGRRFSQ
jgi:hypothetical protein